MTAVPLAALFLAGCGEPVGAPCVDGSECASGRCLGVTTDPVPHQRIDDFTPPPPPQRVSHAFCTDKCGTDAACPTGFRCLEESCAPVATVAAGGDCVGPWDCMTGECLVVEQFDWRPGESFSICADSCAGTYETGWKTTPCAAGTTCFGERCVPDARLEPVAERAACAAGTASVQDCRDLAVRYLNGNRAPLDVAAGIDVFTRTCDRGDALACTLLADALVRRAGPGDLALADAKYAAGCEAGRCADCVGVAWRRLGQDPPLPGAKAVVAKACTTRVFVEGEGELRWRRPAWGADRFYADPASKGVLDLPQVLCDDGFVPGCLDALRRKDPAEAEAQYRALCDDGVADACAGVAQLLLTREPPDTAAAAPLLARACGRAADVSCYPEYLESGVEKRARRLCDAGLEVGCVALSAELNLWWRDQPPAEADAAMATRLCEGKGHPEACFVAARLHTFRKEYDGLAERLGRACDAKVGVACLELAWRRAEGAHVERDPAAAAKAFTAACALPAPLPGTLPAFGSEGWGLRDADGAFPECAGVAPGSLPATWSFTGAFVD